MKKKIKFRTKLSWRTFALNAGIVEDNSKLTGYINLNSEEFELIDSVKNIWLVTDDDYLHKHGLVFGATLKLSMFNGDIAYIVAVDEYFRKLPKYAQKVIIAHEVGHIYSNHLDNISTRKDTWKMLIKRAFYTPEIEYEADLVGSKYVGTKNMIMALSWINRYTDLPIYSKREMKRRISALRNL